MLRWLLARAANACALLVALTLFAPALFLALVVLAGSTAAADGTVVHVDYGTMLTELAHIASVFAMPLFLLLVSLLPAPIRALLMAAQVDKLVANAVAAGVNATEGAMKGKALDVDVGSRVLAVAGQYALDQAPKLVAWAGGPDGIKTKVFRALHLDESVTAEALGVNLGAGR